jgi:predicted GNAT family N-acyltransferase
MSEHIRYIDHASALMARAFELRHEVFVVEQSVPVELEIDDNDSDAVHLVAVRGEDEVVGTLRIVARDEIAKIGRLAVRADARRGGVGRRLMLEALAYAERNGFRDILLSAQLTATDFYVRLGFKAEGDVFDDAGIPHIDMRKTLPGRQ